MECYRVSFMVLRLCLVRETQRLRLVAPFFHLLGTTDGSACGRRQPETFGARLPVSVSTKWRKIRMMIPILTWRNKLMMTTTRRYIHGMGLIYPFSKIQVA